MSLVKKKTSPKQGSSYLAHRTGASNGKPYSAPSAPVASILANWRTPPQRCAGPSYLFSVKTAKNLSARWFKPDTTSFSATSSSQLENHPNVFIYIVLHLLFFSSRVHFFIFYFFLVLFGRVYFSFYFSLSISFLFFFH